jgi:protein SCO1/2
MGRGMTRLRLALITLLACAAAAAAAIALAGAARNEGSAAVVDGGAVNGFDGALRPPGIPPQDFALRDQDGTVTRLADDRGKVVVLTFMYSTCQDTCPITAQQIRGALDQLGHDVPALAISVDPANDTPQRAQSFLLRQKLTGRMRFLLGSRAQLRPIWRSYGIRPQGNGFEHSAYVLLIDRRGRQRIGFPVDQLTPEGLAHDIRKLESER